MLRTRDLFVVTIPSAFLSLAAQPTLDGWLAAPAAARETTVVATAAEAPRASPPAAATRSADETPTAPVVRPRPRVGCEGAISALAGQEARRMLPSRCLV